MTQRLDIDERMLVVMLEALLSYTGRLREDLDKAKAQIEQQQQKIQRLETQPKGAPKIAAIEELSKAKLDWYIGCAGLVGEFALLDSDNPRQRSKATLKKMAISLLEKEPKDE